MPVPDCDELLARADMLHTEARLGVEKAVERGDRWAGFSEQLAIAARCEDLAEKVETQIEEHC